MAVTFVEYPKFTLKNYSEFFRTNKAKDTEKTEQIYIKNMNFGGNIFVETYLWKRMHNSMIKHKYA